jgi:hypothetical protein
MLLDYKALQLKLCLAQTVLYDGGQFEIADPLKTVLPFFAPVGSLKDKINTFVLKQKLIRKSIKGIFCKSKVKFGTIEKLRIQLEND